MISDVAFALQVNQRQKTRRDKQREKYHPPIHRIQFALARQDFEKGLLRFLRTRTTLGRHVSREVADKIWQERDQVLEGGLPQPHELTATVLFSDFKGFTSVSETMSPKDLMSWLNAYLDAMTQVIINHGREAGASLAHPHGQLLGLPFVPGEMVEEQRAFTRFEGGCILCATIEAELVDGKRVLFSNDEVVCVSPYWAGSPYELLIIPRSHDLHLTDSTDATLDAVGIAIRDATLYTTYSPCLMCSKMIINAGIRRVVYNEAYPLNDTATAMLREAGVDLVKLKM